MKYQAHDRWGASYKDVELKEREIVKSRQVNEKVSTSELDPSLYLKLLTMHEDNMKKLKTVLGKEELCMNREARARCWARERCLAEISRKREEREDLELIWAIDREL